MSVTSVTSQVFGSPWFFTPSQYSSIHVLSSSFVCGWGRATCCEEIGKRRKKKEERRKKKEERRKKKEERHTRERHQKNK